MLPLSLQPLRKCIQRLIELLYVILVLDMIHAFDKADGLRIRTQPRQPLGVLPRLLPRFSGSVKLGELLAVQDGLEIGRTLTSTTRLRTALRTALRFARITPFAAFISCRMRVLIGCACCFLIRRACSVLTGSTSMDPQCCQSLAGHGNGSAVDACIRAQVLLAE